MREKYLHILWMVPYTIPHIFHPIFCAIVWGWWVRVVHKVLRETKWVLDSNHTGLQQCILYVLGASNGKILHGMRGNLHVKDATQLF